MKLNIFNFIKTACVITVFCLFCSCREGNQNEGTNTTNDTGSQNYGETEGGNNAQGVDAEGAAGGTGRENNTGDSGNSTNNTGNGDTTAPTSTGVNNPATVKDNTSTGNRQQ